MTRLFISIFARRFESGVNGEQVKLSHECEDLLIVSFIFITFSHCPLACAERYISPELAVKVAAYDDAVALWNRLQQNVQLFNYLMCKGCYFAIFMRNIYDNVKYRADWSL